MNYNSPTEALSTFNTSRSQQSLDRNSQSTIHEHENTHYASTSTVAVFDSTLDISGDAEEAKANGTAPWVRRPNSPTNSEER